MKHTLVLIAALLVAGCRTEPAPTGTAGSPDDAKLVLAYWDGGIHMIGEPRFVMFAAWSDGMVKRRVVT